MGIDKQDRVSIDQSRIQQARAVQQAQSQSVDSNTVSSPCGLNVQSPSISRYDYNGNGLNIKSGQYLKEGAGDDGEAL